MSGELALTLVWRHGFGGRAAYFDALAEGRILGARCPECGHTTVPPRRVCPQDGAAMVGVELPPTGVVVSVTTGAVSRLLGAGVQMFGLVRVTGSDVSVLARIAGEAAAGDAVALVPQGEVVHPSQRLVFARRG